MHGNSKSFREREKWIIQLNYFQEQESIKGMNTYKMMLYQVKVKLKVNRGMEWVLKDFLSQLVEVLTLGLKEDTSQLSRKCIGFDPFLALLERGIVSFFPPEKCSPLRLERRKKFPRSVSSVTISVQTLTIHRMIFGKLLTLLVIFLECKIRTITVYCSLKCREDSIK